jgi:hypothetical protein
MKKEKKYPKKTKEDIIYKPAIKHEYSEFQKQIFIDVNKGEGHTIVEAFAGSAKSWTILESLKYIPRGKKFYF